MATVSGDDFQKASAANRVGRGAGELGGRGAKKQRPWLGRRVLQNFWGTELPKPNYIYRDWKPCILYLWQA